MPPQQEITTINKENYFVNELTETSFASTRTHLESSLFLKRHLIKSEEMKQFRAAVQNMKSSSSLSNIRRKKIFVKSSESIRVVPNLTNKKSHGDLIAQLVVEDGDEARPAESPELLRLQIRVPAHSRKLPSNVVFAHLAQDDRPCIAGKLWHRLSDNLLE